MWQALTSMSVCFKIGDVALDTSGLRDAMVDFFLNNPVTKAPSSRFKSRGLPAIEASPLEASPLKASLETRLYHLQ